MRPDDEKRSSYEGSNSGVRTNDGQREDPNAEDSQTDYSGINPISESMSRITTTTMPIEISHFNALKANPRTANRTKAPTSTRRRVTRLTMQNADGILVYNRLDQRSCLD